VWPLIEYSLTSFKVASKKLFDQDHFNEATLLAVSSIFLPPRANPLKKY